MNPPFSARLCSGSCVCWSMQNTFRRTERFIFVGLIRLMRSCCGEAQLLTLSLLDDFSDPITHQYRNEPL
jgi:hypothetical protein